MRRRLLLTYLTLTAAVLLTLGVPLALGHARSASQQLATTRAQETRQLALEAQEMRAGRVPAAAFEKRLRSYGTARRTTAVLVGPTGRVAAASRADVHDATAALRSPLERALRGTSTGPPRQAAATLRPGRVVLAEPVRDGGEVVGAVGTVASPAAVQREVNAHLLLLAGVAALALTAVGVASVPLSRWLLRPLQQFDTTVRALIGGAPDARVRCGAGPRELRAPADAFNRLADHLVTSLEAQQAFVADASHQMRNPLTALRLRVETLEADVRPATREQFQQAVAEIERLSIVLDQLLRLARAEDPRARDRFRPRAPVDVGEVIALRAAAWEQAAARKQVRLLTPGRGAQGPARTPGCTPADTPACSPVCTPGHLEQILDVLLDNALHASSAGTAITLRHTVSGAHARIQVIDEGTGLSPEECRRAPDRFWRGSNAAGREGTGLGLAIAAGLARADGGALCLRPATPCGIEARVELPLGSPAARAAVGRVLVPTGSSAGAE